MYEFLLPREYLSFCISSENSKETENAKKRYSTSVRKIKENFCVLPDGKKHGPYERRSSESIFQGFFVDGKLNGRAVWWYISGEKMAEENYKDSVLDGDLICFRIDGSIHAITKYSNGKLKMKVSFSESGTCYYDEIVGGVIHGKGFSWNKEGVKISEENWNCGKMEGEFFRWNNVGELTSKLIYKNSELLEKWTYRKNGSVASREICR